MITTMKQQANNFWQHQNKTQRILLVALVVIGIAAIIGFVTWASTPTYTPAFRGLSEEDAGQIVEKLDELGIPYQLEDSGTILVQTDQVYETRLKMAREGLPQDSTVGFELFSTNTLGMTEFTQRVNYQRALEGELERTIGSLEAIEAVRVHIVTPEKTLLASEQPPTTASVTVQTRPGKQLDQAQVRAISHLVASSIEGLKPESVVIVDAQGNMLSSGEGSGSETDALVQSDSRRAVELAAAREVQNKVQALLDSVLGPNRSVVQASVLLDWTQREITSQTFNPTPAAVRSSQTLNETYTTDGTETGGVPGAASNLPTPVATLTTTDGSVIYERVEQTYNYEISQTQSTEIVAPGQLKRVSLSVLVDGVSDPQQLRTLEAAVAAAAGIDQARGDTLSVQTLAFDRTFYASQAEELEQDAKMDEYLRIGTAVGAALLLLILIWYFSRLFRNLRLATSETWIPVMKPVTEAALSAPVSAGSLMPGPMAMAAMPALEEPAKQEAPAWTPPQHQHSQPAGVDEQMQKALIRLSEENPASVAEIIQIWLSEDEKHA